MHVGDESWREALMDRSHIPKRIPHGLWAGFDPYLSMNGSHPTSPDPVLEPHLGDRYVAGNGPRLSCAPWVAGATRRATDPHPDPDDVGEPCPRAPDHQARY